MNVHANVAAGRTRGSTPLMRAAVLTGPRSVKMREVPVPEPGPGEVRVQLAGCGVCSSNVTPWTGPGWMDFPTEPGGLGHEGWGFVDAVGAGVTGIREGDHVTTLFQKSYADYDVGPAGLVIPVPQELDAANLPGEPLGCAVNVIRRSRIRRGRPVAVVGLGFMGLLLVRLAALAGADVVAVGRKPEARSRATAMGAAAAVSPENVHEASGSAGRESFDVVIEATGAQEPLDLAASLVAESGRLVIAGYHQDGLRTVDMQSWNWRGIDVINAHERDPRVSADGVREAVDLVAGGDLDPSPLFTHVMELARLNDALELASARPAGFVKALVVTS